MGRRASDTWRLKVVIGLLAIALPVGEAIVKAERWITIHPSGKDYTNPETGEKNYRRILIDDDGRIVGGSIPKDLHGRKIGEAFKKVNIPHPPLAQHLHERGVAHEMRYLPEHRSWEYVKGRGFLHDKGRALPGSVRVREVDKRSVYVDSNYGDRAKLKELGAKWDAEKKKWRLGLSKLPDLMDAFPHVHIERQVAEAYDRMHKHDGPYVDDRGHEYLVSTMKEPKPQPVENKPSSSPLLNLVQEHRPTEHRLEKTPNGHMRVRIGEGFKRTRDIYGRLRPEMGTLAVVVPVPHKPGYLYVESSYEDRNRLKYAGAQWDANAKMWMVPSDGVKELLKRFRHITFEHPAIEAYDRHFGYQGEYPNAQVIEEGSRHSKPQSDDHGIKDDEEERYATMTADEIREHIRSSWPAWKRELYNHAGPTEMTDFGRMHRLRGRLSRDVYFQAMKEGLLINEDGEYFIVPARYPKIYYEKRKAEKEAQEKRSHELANIALHIQQHGTYPDANNKLPMPDGERYDISPWNEYGGGESIILDKQHGRIWHVKNNGGDSDDWRVNNIRTGGAGAVGRYVAYDENLAQRIRSLMGGPLQKSVRTKSEWRKVRRRKIEEYGTDETFADPIHNSYPLTKNGKPSRKRTLAAWRYINQEKNASKYSEEQLKRVKAHIRRFAKQHFDLELQDGEETKKSFRIALPVNF